jgi:hypothetical protein
MSYDVWLSGRSASFCCDRKTFEKVNTPQSEGLAERRPNDVRIALLLTYITLGWMTIEGAAALLLGWASRSSSSRSIRYREQAEMIVELRTYETP